MTRSTEMEARMTAMEEKHDALAENFNSFREETRANFGETNQRIKALEEKIDALINTMAAKVTPPAESSMTQNVEVHDPNPSISIIKGKGQVEGDPIHSDLQDHASQYNNPPSNNAVDGLSPFPAYENGYTNRIRSFHGRVPPNEGAPRGDLTHGHPRGSNLSPFGRSTRFGPSHGPTRDDQFGTREEPSRINPFHGHMRNGIYERGNPSRTNDYEYPHDPYDRGGGFNADFHEGSRVEPRTQVRKLEMPIFEGVDASAWVFRTERYFEVNQYRDNEKLKAAAVCLEGRALQWFRWHNARQPFRTWPEFRTALIERFQGQSAEIVHEQFFALTQDGTVGDYRDRFEALSSELLGFSEEALLGNFMRGLKPSIRAAVRVLQPTTLNRAMTLAQLVETRDLAERNSRVAGNFSKPKPLGDAHKAKEALPPPPARSGPYRYITTAEYEAKRAKGLCYRCDEKYAPGHRCAPKTLHVILMEDMPEDDPGPNEDGREKEPSLHTLTLEEGTREEPIQLSDDSTKGGEASEEIAWKAITIPGVLDWEALDEDNQGDQLKEQREAAKEGDPNYTIQGRRLLYKGRFVLPNTSTMIPTLLKEFHASFVGGHSGIQATYKRLKREFYWVGMQADVKKAVEECETCQRNKVEHRRPGGLMQPLGVPSKVWEEATMDFIEGLPRSEGYNSIYVVVDRLSKYAHFVPLSHPHTARSVAEVFIKEVVRLHGVPEVLISDRDPTFLSNFWIELFKLMGSQLRRSTAYHPQTDGQTEVVNRSIGTYLRCFAANSPRTWANLLPWAEYWYNTSWHTAIKTTPYQVLYGREPPKLIPYEKGTSAVQQVDEVLGSREEAMDMLREQLHASNKHMKRRADEKRREVEYKVGDYVLVKLASGRQTTVTGKGPHKLAPKYFGPYQVEKRIGQVAYRVKMPESSNIHPVFHASLLKKAQGPAPRRYMKELEWFPGYQPAFVPEALRGVRFIDGHGEVLIKWKRMPEEDATWELMETFEEQFPDFKLSEKVAQWEDEESTPIHLTKMKASPKSASIRKGVRIKRAVKGPYDISPSDYQAAGWGKGERTPMQNRAWGRLRWKIRHKQREARLAQEAYEKLHEGTKRANHKILEDKDHFQGGGNDIDAQDDLQKAQITVPHCTKGARTQALPGGGQNAELHGERPKHQNAPSPGPNAELQGDSSTAAPAQNAAASTHQKTAQNAEHKELPSKGSKHGVNEVPRPLNPKEHEIHAPHAHHTDPQESYEGQRVSKRGGDAHLEEPQDIEEDPLNLAGQERSKGKEIHGSQLKESRSKCQEGGARSGLCPPPAL